MTNHVLNFDFHGAVALRVESADAWTRDYFSREYGWAGASPSPDGDGGPGGARVELAFGYSALPRRPGDGYSFISHKLLARWFYRVELEGNRIAIEAIGNRASVPMIQHMLVHPAIRQLCSRQGRLLLHSAALAYRDRSLLITGPGGTGKTTTSSLLLSSGDREWAVLGDDYAFVDPAGKTLAYRTRAHLYRDLLRFVPTISHRLTARERLHLSVFGLIRTLSGQRIKWPLRIDLGRLWPRSDIKTEAALGAIYLLRRVNGSQIAVRPVQDRKEAARSLLDMNFGEARHYLRLVSEQLETGGWSDHWRQAEAGLIRELVERTPIFWLELPKRSVPGELLGDGLADQLTRSLAMDHV